MKLINKKQLKDAYNKKALYLALLLITIFGMIFYSGFTSVRNNLTYSINYYYETQNLADYTIKTTTNFTTDEINKLNNIALFTDFDAYKFETIPNGVLYTKSSLNVNTPYLKEGKISSDKNCITIDYDYAKNKNLNINDNIIINKQIYKITALAKFPDYIFKGNYMPSIDSTFVALKYVDNVETVNQISIKTTLDYNEVKEILEQNLDSNFTLISMQSDYHYTRVNDDLGLINAILFIFPIACFLSIIIILFINYNKIIQDQKKYIGILKANGFKIYKLYFSLIYIPLLIVLVGSIIGSILGLKIIPLIYIGIIDNYYCLPPLINNNIVLSVILPIIILVLTALITITIPLFFTINKMPVELIKNEDTNSKARLLFRKTKLPYHLKLIIRNVFTYKKKNICMILSTTLLLGIVLAVFFLKHQLIILILP